MSRELVRIRDELNYTIDVLSGAKQDDNPYFSVEFDHPDRETVTRK
jgi:hypothetical protein